MGYKINNYPDGSKYITVDSFEDNITFRLNSYEDLWVLNQLVDVYNYNGYRPIITIPNLIDAQADRRFETNQSNGLKLICDFLNSLRANFKIFHPHNSEVVEALIDNVEIIDNSYFIKNVFGKLYYDGEKTNPNWNENLVLMSSDAGGFKPLMKLCDEVNWQGDTFSASKARTYNSGKSSLIQKIDKEDFEGKDILLIDDICVYGGTFKGIARALRKRNCGKLYLAVSHMTVENLGLDDVTLYFNKVFTTNSKYEEYYNAHHYKPKNLEVIKLC